MNNIRTKHLKYSEKKFEFVEGSSKVRKSSISSGLNTGLPNKTIDEKLPNGKHVNIWMWGWNKNWLTSLKMIEFRFFIEEWTIDSWGNWPSKGFQTKAANAKLCLHCRQNAETWTLDMKSGTQLAKALRVSKKQIVVLAVLPGSIYGNSVTVFKIPMLGYTYKHNFPLRKRNFQGEEKESGIGA